MASTIHSLIPSESIPFFVIQENSDDCLICWLIKRILLIFQCCRSTETINEFLPVFSKTNIAWLTESQIHGLQDETIRRLGRAQLQAFSETQVSYFTNTQRAIFEQALREPLHSPNNVRTREPSQEPSRRLRETTLFADYYERPEIQMQVNAELSENERALLSHPEIKSCVLSMWQHLPIENLVRLKEGFALPTVHQWLTEDHILPEKKELLRLLLSPEDLELLNQVDRIHQLPDWESMCQEITLDNLLLLKCLLAPSSIPQLPLSTFWNAKDQTSAYISFKSNGWEPLELIPLGMRIPLQEHFPRLIEQLIEIGADPSTPLSSVERCRQARGQTPASEWGISVDESLERGMTTLGSFFSLTRSQIQNLSSYKIYQFAHTAELIIDEHTHRMDESRIDENSVKEITLAQFRNLSCDKINELLPSLSPSVAGLLSEKQLKGLETQQLSDQQFFALISAPPFRKDDEEFSKKAKLISLFSAAQMSDIRAIASRIYPNFFES